MPESPRYLIIKGDETKAKKVLALVARINCVTLTVGRLVTQEEKEEVIRQRTQPTDRKASNVFVESMFTDNKQQRTSSSSYYGTLPGEETPPLEDEVFTNNHVHFIDVSAVQKLLSSTTQCSPEDDKEQCSCLCIQKTIKDKVVNYYHWLLLLFKNGWWRTTLLLWYLW